MIVLTITINKIVIISSLLFLSIGLNLYLINKSSRKQFQDEPLVPFFSYRVYSDYYLGREDEVPNFRIHTSTSENNEFAREGCFDCTVQEVSAGENKVEIWTDKGDKNPIALIVNTKRFYPNIYNFIIHQIDPKTSETIEFSDGELKLWLKQIEKW